MSQVTSENPSSPSGDFHTQSNLTQTLNTIATEHFKGTHKNEGSDKVALPQFMAEALHMAFSNVAGALNGNPFHRGHWSNAAAYFQVVANILEKGENAKKAAEELTLEKAQETIKEEEDSENVIPMEDLKKENKYQRNNICTT